MKLYHITERKNLSSILRHGLVPRLDTGLNARDLDQDTVINLGGRSIIETLLWDHPWDNPILLEVNISRKNLVSIEHTADSNLSWYISRSAIPATNIKVIGDPSKFIGYNHWRSH